MGMNNNTLGIVAVSLVALGGIATIALQKSKPQILSQTLSSGSDDGKYGMVIRASLTDEQWNAVKAIINRSPAVYSAADRTKLYRIRHFVLGAEDPPPPSPPPPPQDEDLDSGNLPVNQLMIDRGSIKNSLPEEFTGYAFQIGIGGKDSFQTYQTLPMKAPNMPQAHGKINMRESKEMVEEVNNVLNPP